MAHDREHHGEERREYPAPNPGRPSYEGQCGWSGSYSDPHMMGWRQGYEQSYYEPQRQFYGSAYGGSGVCHSSASRGISEVATTHTDRASFLNYSQSQQQARSSLPVADSEMDSNILLHPVVPKDAPLHIVDYSQSAGGPLPTTATHFDVQAPAEPLHRSGEQTSKAPIPGTYMTDSTSISDYAGSFLAQVQKFVVRHSEAFDLLVEGHGGSEDEIHHNAHSGDMFEFGQPDALEYHMNVDSHLRQSRFLELVSVGDVVQGHVIDKTLRELVVQVTSFVGTHKYRELSDIGIKGSIPLDNLADIAEKCDDVLSEMEIDDVVQAIVTYQKESGCVVLSFRGDHIEQLCTDGQLPSGVKVGYIEGKRPLHPRSSIPRPDDYICQLEEDPGFLNPSSNDNLKQVLGIHCSSETAPPGPGKRPTLMKDFQKKEFPESDYCHALRKAQRSKWSMDTVAVGVKYFKAGGFEKAKKYFDHALEIDAENVEGLVARGALFANDGKYEEGIADFEKALTLKHTHRNARNYLVQTQVAFGERLEREGKLEAAMKCYREALADDSHQETARERLKIITTAMEKQAAEKREIERKKSEEKATLKKLQKLIKREHERKNKKPRRKKTSGKRSKESKAKKSKKKKVSSRTKTKKEDQHRRHGNSNEYSSDESTTTVSSERSRSGSISPLRQSRSKIHHSSRSASPRTRSRSNSRTRSGSHSPRQKTKQRQTRTLQSKPSKSRRSRSWSSSASHESSSPISKHKSKHKHWREHKL